jgi:hypothetical protein
MEEYDWNDGDCPQPIDVSPIMRINAALYYMPLKHMRPRSPATLANRSGVPEQ